MGQYSKLIILAFWLPQAAFQLLEYLYWIQVKEYRYDRIISFLKTQSGRDAFGVITQTLKYITLYAAFINFAYIDFYIVLIAYLDYKSFNKYITKKIRRPIVTLRMALMLLISVITIVITALSSIVNSNSLIALFVMIETVILLIGFAGLIITTPIVALMKERLKKSALKRFHQVKPSVVGITGSYGKTTTKEFIYQLIESTLPTEKSSGSENTEFGIYRKIAELKKNTQVFVMEVGAYKIGEIKRIASVFKPNIAVITGIEPQHVELFGSLRNIKAAKYELIDSLRSGGIGIFNIDSNGSRQLHEKAKKGNLKLLTVSTKNRKADAYLEFISQKDNGVVFNFHFSGKKQRLFAPVPGKSFLLNIGAAILVARQLRVPWYMVIEEVAKLTMPDKTMNIRQLKSGALFIDDSYNSSPSGFVTALDYLNSLKGRKVVITSGMIELGNHADKAYKKVVSKMKSVDLLVVTRVDAMYSFTDYKGKIKYTKNVEELVNTFDSLNTKGTAILAEGKQPTGLMKEIE